MPIHQLTSTDAFVVFDLDGAEAAGVVRSAPKILVNGAKDLARSRTYAFATVEMRRGGASAGINAAPDDRVRAIAAFVEELTPMVAEGTLALEPAKGVEAPALAALAAADGRHPVAATEHRGDPLATHLAGLGPVLAADEVLGGLEGRTVAIEGFAAAGPAIADAAVDRGARVVAVATGAGSVSDPQGLDPVELRAGWARAGDALVGEDAEAREKIFGTDADVLFAGSRMGAIDHTTAEGLSVRVVVPHDPIPYTARALAVMGRAGITAVPDFVPTAAPLLAWWPPMADPTPDAVVAAVTDAVVAALDETLGHDEGGFLGACYRAEAFLATWRASLPFGRPLAS